MKFIKTYIPIIITILSFLFIPFIFGIIKINDNFNSPRLEMIKSTINIISIVLLILVILETIICMLHAFRHREIECHILLGIVILLFNIVIIPIYILKYVVRDSKIKIKIIILSILSILSILMGFISYNIVIDKYGYYTLENDVTRNYQIEETNISIELPISYKKEEHKAWNLYFFDYNRGIELGIKVIDLSKYNVTSSELIDLLALNIKDKKLLKEDITDYKVIRTYRGKYQDSYYQYKISSVNLNNKYLVCVMGITKEEDFNLYEAEIDEIVKYVRVSQQ